MLVPVELLIPALTRFEPAYRMAADSPKGLSARSDCLATNRYRWANTIRCIAPIVKQIGGLFDQHWAGRAALTNPAVQPNPIDLNVTLGDNKLSIATGDGKMLAPRITSNNKIPLNFTTKEFVGEYFHYAGDLFLIHKSGVAGAAQLLAHLTPDQCITRRISAQSILGSIPSM
jgi:hypothetical protein